MKLCFDSIEEAILFVGSLKGTRGKKGGTTEDAGPQAPEPIQPPVQTQQPAFAPQQQPAAGPAFTPPQAQPFPVTPPVDPVVASLVQRIAARIDNGIASGQPAEPALNWFRTELAKHGHDAANATLDQVKQMFLPKLSVPSLEGIAKLTGA